MVGDAEDPDRLRAMPMLSKADANEDVVPLKLVGIFCVAGEVTREVLDEDVPADEECIVLRLSR